MNGNTDSKGSFSEGPEIYPKRILAETMGFCKPGSTYYSPTKNNNKLLKTSKKEPFIQRTLYETNPNNTVL